MVTYERGTIVRYARPEQGEEALTFTLLEDNDDRVLIESRDFPDFRIAPREVVAKDEIVCCGCGMPHTAEHACEPLSWNYHAS